MHFFDLVLVLFSVFYIGFNRSLNKKIDSKYILGMLLLVMALQLILNGYRWQMIPAYLIWLIAAITAFRQKDHKPKTIARVFKTIGVLILLTFSIGLPSVLPVFELPEPRGAFAVGTTSTYVTTDRDEIVTKDPTDKRELLYKIWYPSEANVASLKGEKYVDQGSRNGFATKYGLPPSALNYLDLVKTFVYEEIPLASGRFPVLIFSHGYGSKATGYYALLTELASQGYVIINMNHTYESLGVTFPDGSIAYFDYDYQNEISKESMQVVEPLKNAFADGLSYEERHPIIKQTMKDYHMSDMMRRWAEDIIFTLDLLEKWNSEGLLKDKIDLDKIGVFGHSVGGGTAANTAILDSRVKAAANLDGIPWGNLINTRLNIPFLYVSADWPAAHEDVNSHVFINKSTDYFYETKLLKSGHPNFMDIPFMIPVQSLSGSGTIDPYQGMETVTKLLTSFFDKHLKNDATTDPQEISEAHELLEMTVYIGDSINTVSK